MRFATKSTLAQGGCFGAFRMALLTISLLISSLIVADPPEARAQELLKAETPFLMAGDYNVIPQDEDAARPEAWAKDALGLPESRAAFRRIVHLGLTDAFRARVGGPGHYSFWDYQGGAWDRDDGIRIDHVLLCPYAADWLEDAGIEREVRGGEKPSDHVPVWVDLAF